MRKVAVTEVFDRRHGTTRAVTATIDAPSLKGLDVKALAQRAYDAPDRKLTDGEVTVRIKLFGGR